MNVYRDIKASEFSLMIEVSRNQAGYNQRDVHGQVQVVMNRKMTRLLEHNLDLIASDLETAKKVRFRLRENQVEVFDALKI